MISGMNIIASNEKKKSKSEMEYRYLLNNIQSKSNYITQQLNAIATPQITRLDAQRPTHTLVTGSSGGSSPQSLLDDNSNNRPHITARVSDLSLFTGGSMKDVSPIKRASNNINRFGRGDGAENIISRSSMSRETKLKIEAFDMIKNIVTESSDQRVPSKVLYSLISQALTIMESVKGSMERIDRRDLKRKYLTNQQDSPTDTISISRGPRGDHCKDGGTRPSTPTRGEEKRNGIIGSAKDLPQWGKVNKNLPSSSVSSPTKSNPAATMRGGWGNPWAAIIEHCYQWPHERFKKEQLDAQNLRQLQMKGLMLSHEASHGNTGTLGGDVLDVSAMQCVEYASIASITTPNSRPIENCTIITGESNRKGDYKPQLSSSFDPLNSPLLLSPESVKANSNISKTSSNLSNFQLKKKNDDSPTLKYESLNVDIMSTGRSEYSQSINIPTCSREGSSGGSYAELPVSHIFYNETDIATAVLDIIDHHRGKSSSTHGNNRYTGSGGDETSSTPNKEKSKSNSNNNNQKVILVSDEYNAILKDYFVSATNPSSGHPIMACIREFMTANDSIILRMARPEGIRDTPPDDRHQAFFSLPLEVILGDDGMDQGEVNDTPTPSTTLNTIGYNTNSITRAPAEDGADDMKSVHQTHYDPSPTFALSGGPSLTSAWGAVHSSDCENLFSLDRMRFISLLCNTVLEKMFTEKKMPIFVMNSSSPYTKYSMNDCPYLSSSVETTTSSALFPAREQDGDCESQGGCIDSLQIDGRERSLGDAIKSHICKDNSILTKMSKSFRVGGGGGGGGGCAASSAASTSPSITWCRKPTTVRHMLDITDPFVDVLPELIDGQIEMLALRRIFTWVDETERERKRIMTSSQRQKEREGFAKLTSGVGLHGCTIGRSASADSLSCGNDIHDAFVLDMCSASATRNNNNLSKSRETLCRSGRLLLEGAALKLKEHFDYISRRIKSSYSGAPSPTKEKRDEMEKNNVNDDPILFCEDFYNLFMDALFVCYNVTELSVTETPGGHSGADSIFPCVVYAVAVSQHALLIASILKWATTSTVARRLPPFMSTGVEAYMLQSFGVAANAVIREMM